MRPTPGEVIAGVRRILRDVVAPEVSSDYARAELRSVLAVLGQVDWDDGPLRVLQDNNDLRALLGRCTAWIRSEPARARALAHWVAGVDAAAANQAGALACEVGSFRDANQLNAHYRRAVSELVDALAGWLRDHPSDGAAVALHADLWNHLASARGSRAADP